MGIKRHSLLGQPLVSGFLSLDTWANVLHCHPHWQYVAFLLQGISQGFFIGCWTQCRLEATPITFSLPWTTTSVACDQSRVGGRNDGGCKLPRVVLKNSLGVISSCTSQESFTQLVIYQHYKMKCQRLHQHYKLCSLPYVSIEQEARLVKAAGHRATMTKFDLCSAYRRVLVHPLDYHLLGVE